MDQNFFNSFRKTLLDAKKLGVADEKSEMLINDFLKVMSTEIKTKTDAIQRLQGEIISMKKMFDLWNNIINSHIRLERQNIVNQERIDNLTGFDDVVEKFEKKVRKRRTKKEIEAGKK